MGMASYSLALIQTVVLLALAPLLTGAIRKLKAWMQSRRGPPVYQPYLDLAKLMHKGSVVSEDASWLTTITPYVCLASVILAALLVPAFVTDSFGFLGDLIVLVYLFAMTRFFMALAAINSSPSRSKTKMSARRLRPFGSRSVAS